MRRSILAIAVLCFAAGAAVTALAEKEIDLHLRGDRFRPLTYSELTPAQKALADHVLSGERASLGGPYNVLLRSPEMGDLAQQYGAYTRFHSAVSKRISELAIMITARVWTSQYPWYSHRKYALDAGLSPALLADLAAGKRPSEMSAEEAAAYDFCWELLESKAVSDATFKAAVDRFGERGVVDLMGIMGYYSLVSMALNTDRYPLPEGATPELKPIK